MYYFDAFRLAICEIFDVNNYRLVSLGYSGMVFCKKVDSNDYIRFELTSTEMNIAKYLKHIESFHKSTSIIISDPEFLNKLTKFIN